jgi:hypothetical protein
MMAEQLGAELPKLRVIEVERQKYFHKACAQNLGAALTRGDVLFFCDCDILIDPELVDRLSNTLLERPGRFATLAGVRESEQNSRGGKHVTCFGYELRIHTRDGRKLVIVDHEEDARDGTRNAPGLLFVRRSDFLEVGGYNSGLHGWGWEDQDMIGRLTLGAGLDRIIEGYAVHLSHDDQARVAHYPVADRWESRDRTFRQALANYDAGRFQGTYESDVRQYGPLARCSPK